MSKSEYRYNSKTLRYERVRFSIWRFLGLSIAYVVLGCLFFLALDVLENTFIETDTKKLLRKKNNTLSVYKASLTSRLNDSKNQLEKLQQKEAGLYQQLFEAPPETPTKQVSSTLQLQNTKAQLNELQQRAMQIKNKSEASSSFLGQHITIDKSDLTNLFNMPIGLPVANITPNNLISGFGIRINPFHKAKYHHDGIDLSFIKGTEVVATGNGNVIRVVYPTTEGGLGNYIEIDHGNGIISRYAYLQDVTVGWGQKIKKGQKIGTVGNSGSSAAPHLHYEIIKDGKPVDPMTYMVEVFSAVAHNQLVSKSKKLNQSLD